MNLLSRAGTVIRLIKIRKIVREQEDELSEPPGEYFQRIKQELDDLLVDIIGVPEEGRHEINEILMKAISGEIKPETAAVAVHEIFREYHQDDASAGKEEKSADNKTRGEKKLNELYKSGYR
ncbi:MAG: hypothetical protein ACOCQB_00010 [Halanaerobiaceae bacterium]